MLCHLRKISKCFDFVSGNWIKYQAPWLDIFLESEWFFMRFFSLWYIKQSSKKNLQYMYLLNKPQFRKLGLPSSFWNFANRHQYIQFFTNTINITTNRYTIFCKMIWMKRDRWKQWSFLQILSQEFPSPKISPLQKTKRDVTKLQSYSHSQSSICNYY